VALKQLQNKNDYTPLPAT